MAIALFGILIDFANPEGRSRSPHWRTAAGVALLLESIFFVLSVALLAVCLVPLKGGADSLDLSTVAAAAFLAVAFGLGAMAWYFILKTTPGDKVVSLRPRSEA